MADSFKLEVATPEREIVNEPVMEAEIPGESGYMGILSGHAPLLSALSPGVLTYTNGGAPHVLAIDGGFVEIFENHVRVLADHAERAEEIEVERARRTLEQGAKDLKDAHDEQSSDTALRTMKQAQARLDAVEKASGSSH